jgi:CHAD domain-containing protein
VRDLDVFAENTRQYIKIARVRNSPAMNALLTVLDEQHQAAHRNLIDWLDSDEYLRFVFAFFDVLKVKATTNHLPKSELLTTPISYEVRHVLPALIQEQFRAVRQYEILLPCTDVRTLHRLRIHDKKLRYSLEAFRVVLGRPANDVIRQVKMLQSYLGDMNDASVAANRLVELRTQHPALDDSAIEAYRVYCATRCERYVAGFPRVWAKFNQQRLRRSLGRALANC